MPLAFTGRGNLLPQDCNLLVGRDCPLPLCNYFLISSIDSWNSRSGQKDASLSYSLLPPCSSGPWEILGESETPKCHHALGHCLARQIESCHGVHLIPLLPAALFPSALVPISPLPRRPKSSILPQCHTSLSSLSACFVLEPRTPHLEHAFFDLLFS